ncbi:MAG: HAD-IC family P-type ATPase [Acidimicrobiales bacterium]
MSTASPARGLTTAEVADRVARGQVNSADTRTSRTVGEILRANVFTRFNGLLTALVVVTLATGRYQDAAFFGVVVTNALIGIVQETRAKRTLDRLAVLNAPTARVRRDGASSEIPVDEVVLGDLVELRAGDQVPADGALVSQDGLEVDESMLTGESDPVAKADGDGVLSGAIVVAGSGCFTADAVGDDAYARRIAKDARRFTRTASELQDAIDKLITYATWVIVGTTPLLLWSQFRTTDGWRDALSGSVAALVGMVPEGLVLLTSISFLLAAVTLARRQVLVQELPAVEGLARVDVVCLDKTGTLTDGDISFDALHPLGGHDAAEAEAALGAVAGAPEGNATARAIAEALPAPAGWARSGGVPFSSARKWSATAFSEQGWWVLGAPDVLLGPDDAARAQVQDLAARGRRVVLLARCPAPLDGDRLPPDLDPVALATLAERIRPDAAETLRYFAEQGVTIKVLSGDNPSTVGHIAAEIGLEVGEPIDARTLPDEPEGLAEAIEAHTVFGRVSPQQKRSFVKALQAGGHTVAMTGDGVNDALALKDADIGVAMGSGAPATRAVAQLVLLDSRFAQLPHVLGEGRRVIANIERVANLFVAKNVYAFLLVLATAAIGFPIPFLPRHLTLISSLTIGIPAFFLALGPSGERHRPGFLRRVLRLAVPSGASIGLAIFAAYVVATLENVPKNQRQTAATLSAMVAALWLLGVLSRPWAAWKIALLAAMAGSTVFVLVIPGLRHYYALEIPWNLLLPTLLIGGGGALAVELSARWARRTPSPTRRPNAFARLHR